MQDLCNSLFIAKYKCNVFFSYVFRKYESNDNHIGPQIIPLIMDKNDISEIDISVSSFAVFVSKYQTVVLFYLKSSNNIIKMETSTFRYTKA